MQISTLLMEMLPQGIFGLTAAYINGWKHFYIGSIVRPINKAKDRPNINKKYSSI